MDGVQPCFGKSRPVRDRQVCGAETETVSALREEVKLGWNFCILEGLKVNKRTLDAGGIVVFRLNQEGGWNLQCGLKRWVHLTIGPSSPAGIDDHLKVGASINT